MGAPTLRVLGYAVHGISSNRILNNEECYLVGLCVPPLPAPRGTLWEVLKASLPRTLVLTPKVAIWYFGRHKEVRKRDLLCPSNKKQILPPI